jgi:DNA-binding CsgD family transcriptional regulator
MDKNTGDFEPLIRLVRERISLSRNKRLREALSERGAAEKRLAKELPAAVAIEWGEAMPGEAPPPSAEAAKLSDKELAALTRKVTRRLEKQGDEGESKILRAARRAPASTDEDEQDEKEQTLKLIAKNAGLTNRERDVYELTLCEVEDEEIAEILGLKRDSLTKTKYRMMQKLRGSAAKVGFSEKLK